MTLKILCIVSNITCKKRLNWNSRTGNKDYINSMSEIPTGSHNGDISYWPWDSNGVKLACLLDNMQ